MEEKMRELKQFMVLIFLISITSIYVYGIISGNDSCRAYRSSCGGGKEAATIKQYIIEGAGYYFKSHSYFQKLLNMVELSELNGFDYKEAKIIINEAVGNIESANETYLNLKNLADATPYDQDVIDLLKSFDYAGFQEKEELIHEIFQRVKGLLSNGEVTGVYIELHSNTSDILEGLNSVKNQIEERIFPDISLLWKLHQKYPKSLLFGQYVSMVFKEIK